MAGVLIMQNRLKPETLPAMQQLNSANLESIMVTGDNPLTACYIAQECQMISKYKSIFLSECTQCRASTMESFMIDVCSSTTTTTTNSSSHPVIDGRVMWRNLDEQEQAPVSLDELCARRYQPPSSNIAVASNSTTIVEMDRMPNSALPSDVELAVTGVALAEMMASDSEAFEVVLKSAHVYARMKPVQKQLLIEALSERGRCVAMCGDGANDCGALKSADVGLSLSEAEASIAAPFTSGIANITCMPRLLREGRCALVTSFQAFKYMTAYSMIQFTTTVILLTVGSMPGPWQYLFIDLFIVMPLAFLSEYAGSYHKLSKRRPVSSLLSREILSSLLLQLAVNVAFQVVAFLSLRTQDWFTPVVLQPDSDNIRCYENTALFVFTNLQYVASICAFSAGKPFRKPIYKNRTSAIKSNKHKQTHAHTHI